MEFSPVSARRLTGTRGKRLEDRFAEDSKRMRLMGRAVLGARRPRASHWPTSLLAFGSPPQQTMACTLATTPVVRQAKKQFITLMSDKTLSTVVSSEVRQYNYLPVYETLMS